MSLIASIPGPNNGGQIKKIINNHLVDGCRFNTGIRVPYDTQLETLKLILDQIGDTDFWLDIKGRQLRITQWSDPFCGEILLNHNLTVDLPAQIIFRNDNICNISNIVDNQLFVYPNPKHAIGAGQSVNIHGSNLKIDNYLTQEDISYLEAAEMLGINKFMLSFVENNDDIKAVQQYCPNAEMYLKIESQKGIEFINTEYVPTEKIHLMAARDDLFTNVENKFDITSVLQTIITKDPQAVVASQIMNSLANSSEISLSDISDLYMLNKMGYQNFMLDDIVCYRAGIFDQVMDYWKEFHITKYRG